MKNQNCIKMSNISKLFNECKIRSLNCSLTYQKINNYSIEIYRGYVANTKFYTDGHLNMSDAVKEALKFIKKL